MEAPNSWQYNEASGVSRTMILGLDKVPQIRRVSVFRRISTCVAAAKVQLLEPQMPLRSPLRTSNINNDIWQAMMADKTISTMEY